MECREPSANRCLPNIRSSNSRAARSGWPERKLHDKDMLAVFRNRQLRFSTLSCPFAGMFFWWFAGTGIEALCAALQSVVRPRIGWVETLFAGILVATGIVALVGILTSTPDDRYDFQFVMLLGAAFLWGALATPTVAARLLQWRIAKRHIAAQSTMASS